ncbi:serine hydrolase domain-containing protein [Rhodanobacter umsongensis]|uniref:Serine hydrolase domain-containing protein n=1 Tax=Rhodanobacter umsongensis TaxID=633153 RepID=A0ABW0JN84_9GAMM
MSMAMALAGLLAMTTTGVMAVNCADPVRNDAVIQSRLDDAVPRLLAEQRVPSVAIAHIENGKIVLAVAYGSQSPGVPATTRTLYNIASMTKPVSAEVELRLASRGRLSLDEPMYRYWVDPDIATDERRKQLTPWLALTHQTGFPNWRRETGGVLTFERSPGQAYGYSGEGFEYMARFTEKKLGIPFEKLAQTLVFEPIGMRDTAYTRRSWFAGRIAVPTDREGKALEPAIAERFFASDQLYTTIGDYARFLLSVMKHEGVNDAIAGERERILVSRKSGICTPAMRNDCPTDIGFGLGWEVLKFGQETVLMHTGMDDGLFTFGYVEPTQGTATVIFTNSANGPRVVLPLLDLLGKDPAFVAFLRRQAGQGQAAG